jgi:LemA protein
MPTVSSRIVLVPLLALSVLLLSGCGYNAMQGGDEAVKASWAEVVNQYKRRADLIPNLVRTVEGFAQQERDVLIQVTEARARVGSVQATPETLNDPAAFAKFTKAQGELGGALSRLLVTVEKYPELKSDALFRDLQSQLEGTENRITVARNRYIKTVQEYNTTVRQFPTNLTAMLFKMDVKPNFAVADEAAVSTPPKVDFNKAPAAPAVPAPQPKAAAPADSKQAAVGDAGSELLKKGY